MIFSQFEKRIERIVNERTRPESNDPYKDIRVVAALGQVASTLDVMMVQVSKPNDRMYDPFIALLTTEDDDRILRPYQVWIADGRNPHSEAMGHANAKHAVLTSSHSGKYRQLEDRFPDYVELSIARNQGIPGLEGGLSYIDGLGGLRLGNIPLLIPEQCRIDEAFPPIRQNTPYR